MENVYGSTPKERELILRKEKVVRCTEMGRCLMGFFKIIIAGIVFAVITIVASVILYGVFAASSASALVAGGKTDGLAGDTGIDGFNVFLIVVQSVALLLNLAGAYFIIRMNKFFDGFKTAGLFYIAQGVLSFIMVFTSDGAYMFFQTLSAIMSVVYMMNFAITMSKALEPTDSYLSDEWTKLKKIFVYLLIGTGVCLVICIVPGLAFLGLIGLPLICLGYLAMSVWYIVLVYKSADSMKVVAKREADALSKEENAALA